MAPVSLYVHAPFCLSKCSYCAFHSRARSGQALASEAEAWLAAVSAHMAALIDRFEPEGLSTVYVGGGSPSVLPKPVISRLLSSVAGFAGAKPLEFSVELNPEDVDDALISTLEDGGVDRISLGAQSLEPPARTAIGRRGEAGSVRRALEAVAGRWRGRWSVDLMYGLPGQTASGIEADARYLTGLGIGHVSLYELTLEPETPLAFEVESGRRAVPDDDESADQCDAASSALYAAGLRRYEVSNWARPGQECLHNSVYWSMGDWLAVGPSAVGNLSSGGGSYLRLENTPDDLAYARDPSGSCTETTISGRDARFEALMTALRTSRGLDLAGFSALFGVDPSAEFGDLPSRFPGLVSGTDGRWAATERGMDTLNSILVAALRNAEEGVRA